MSAGAKPERAGSNRLPDRPLDEPADALGTVRLTGRLGSALIYDKMVDRVVGRRPRDGDLVQILDSEEKPAGWGLYNVRSGIRVRRMSRRAAAPDSAWWAARIDDALAFRRDTIADVMASTSKPQLLEVAAAD